MSFVLSYHDKVDGGYNVKVEINKVNYDSEFEIKQYLGVGMNVMAQKDMAANKLIAMLSRIGKSNRDIFDVWYFLSNRWPINKETIEQRTEMSFKEFLNQCIEALTRDGVQRNLLSGLGELLTAKQKAWTKANLLKETITQLELAKRYT